MRLAICSSKGGVGKTATAANLACVLGRRGRVLAVDADPQDSLGRAFGVVASAETSLAAVLGDGKVTARSIIRRAVAPGVDLIPAHPALEAVGVELAAGRGLSAALRRALRGVDGDYDHIVIDTHGDIGNLTQTALGAADSVLTVFTSDPGSALGAVRLAGFVAAQHQAKQTDAVLLGVACVSWDKYAAAAREVADALQTTPIPVFKTRVPHSRRVPSSTLAKRPVVLSHPNSAVAEAYRDLSAEVIKKYKKRRSD